MRRERNFIPLWRDGDIVVLVKKRPSEKEFYSMMMYIGSSLFGLSDEDILKAWLNDLRENQDGEGRDRRR